MFFFSSNKTNAVQLSSIAINSVEKFIFLVTFLLWLHKHILFHLLLSEVKYFLEAYYLIVIFHCGNPNFPGCFVIPKDPEAQEFLATKLKTFCIYLYKHLIFSYLVIVLKIFYLCHAYEYLSACLCVYYMYVSDAYMDVRKRCRIPSSGAIDN